MKSLKFTLILCLGLLVTLSACTNDEYEEDDDMEEDDMEMSEDRDTMNNSMMTVNAAVAVVHPTDGNNVEGWVTFIKEGNGVRVHGEFSGLDQGEHGFHIHQYGDCRAGDGTSAGGHFNPADNNHAARSDSSRHMGDMGNITADGSGNATVDYVDSVIKMKHILGRGVIIHGGEDDGTSQPSGAAGPRKACGVIGVANSDTGMDSENEMQ